jgi:hypothetical protein
MTPMKDSQGQGHLLPDVRQLDILKRRTIISRKPTRNLFDLTNLWKNIVLLKMDQQVLEDNHNVNINQDDAMDIDSESDDQGDSSPSDENIDPFVQLLRNQGAVF